MVIDYSHGKIYKLTSPHSDEIYIGSTCQSLAVRLGGHKKDWKIWKEGKNHYITSFKLFDLGDVQITLIQLYPCTCKIELEARERFYIQSLECLNKIVPTRTKKEYHEDNRDKILEYKKEYYQENKESKKDYDKKYRETNKEIIKEKHKEYCKKNKERITEKSKEYRKNNKERLKEKNSQNYQDNKENIKEKCKEYRKVNKGRIKERDSQKYTCPCGSTICKYSKVGHERTIKHQDYLKSLEPPKKAKKSK